MWVSQRDRNSSMIRVAEQCFALRMAWNNSRGLPNVSTIPTSIYLLFCLDRRRLSSSCLSWFYFLNDNFILSNESSPPSQPTDLLLDQPETSPDSTKYKTERIKARVSWAEKNFASNEKSKLRKFSARAPNTTKPANVLALKTWYLSRTLAESSDQTMYGKSRVSATLLGQFSIARAEITRVLT